MRTLVLGARGAVGRATVAELRRRGHSVLPAARTAPPGGEAVNLSIAAGWPVLRELAMTVDVIVNASSVEDVRIATHVGTTPVVDVSATGPYLHAVAENAPNGLGILLGAGLVPGLSTTMIDALATRRGDEIDVAVMLGAGEAHGSAAVEWTTRLIGTQVQSAPERVPVPNLHGRIRISDDRGRRSYLRADFPDHTLIGRPRGLAVRTFLALSSPLATGALAVVARMPRLRGALARAPHMGSHQWRLHVTNRRTQQSLSAAGIGQSDATGRLTALAAERMATETPRAAISMDRLITWSEAIAHLTDS